jgi:hypothetical protein
MRKEKLNDFLGQNKEAFKLLAEEIRKVKDIKNVKDEEDLKTRKLAVEMVINWIDGIFTEVTAEELDDLLDEDPIFKMNKTPEKGF